MLPKIPRTYKGLWWLPAAEDKKVAGVLTANADAGLSFETTGNLSGTQHPLFAALSGNPDSYKIIHGATDGNQSITLFGVVAGPNTWSANEITIITHDVRFAVIGAHVGSAEELMLSQLSIECDSLAAWLQISPFHHDHGRPNFTMNYVHPQDIVLFEDATIKWGITWTVTPPSSHAIQLEIHASVTPCFFVKTTQPLSFEDLNREANLFRKLLSFCTSAPIRSTKLWGTLVRGEQHDSIEFLWKDRWDEQAKSEPHLHEIVAPYPAITVSVRPSAPMAAIVRDDW